MSTEQRNQLAVALHYDADRRAAVIAKGKGSIGAKIIEVAKAHDIPIQENRSWPGRYPMSSWATKIPTELYKAVAEVLVFVLRLSAGDSLTFNAAVIGFTSTMPSCNRPAVFPDDLIGF